MWVACHFANVVPALGHASAVIGSDTMPTRKSDLDRFLAPRALLRILIPEVQLVDHVNEVGFFNKELLLRKGPGRRELAGKARFGGSGAAAVEAAVENAAQRIGDAGATVARGAEGAAATVTSAGVSVAASEVGAAIQPEKSLPPSEVDAAFDAIERELPQYILEQADYIRDLCIAFKRPFVSGKHKSYANLIIICGPKGSGRHLSVTAITRLMRDRNLLSRGTVSRINLEKYATEKTGDDLFLPDLYKALYGFDRVIVLDNLEKCHSSVLDKIASLGINGTLRLDKRYITQIGKMAEVTGSLLLGTTEELQCNGKYLVFITEMSRKTIEGMFPNAFMENVLDIISTNRLSERALSILAVSYLEDCGKRVRENLAVELRFNAVEDYIVRHANPKSGACGIRDFVEDWIYKPLIELQLNKAVLRGESYEVAPGPDGLYAVNADKEHNLGAALRRRDDGEGIEKLNEDLERIIGLDSVKSFIKELEYNLKVQKARETQGESAAKISLHTIFTGNPGTGKTTMARLMSRCLKALGYLSSGHLVEVSRGDLVGQYVGETAQKTMDKVRSALGGVLFVDEAYSLARDKGDVFGVEAVDTIVKAMEDNREDLVVILAGYTDEMREFLKTNPGLRSRFSHVIEFPDYRPGEMLGIMKTLAKSNGYVVDAECDEPLLELFEKRQIPGRNDSGNGRLARNILEKAITSQSRRIAEGIDGADRADLNRLCLADFGLDRKEEYDLEAELSRVIGLDSVKDFLRVLEKQLIADEKRRRAGLKVETGQTLNMVFRGNPGTGKTTMARLAAKMMKQMGVLKSGQLVETDRGGLVAEYAGQTANKTTDVFLSALGGVLFIDEAYALGSDGPTGFGREAVDTLVKLMEDHRENIVVVLAGYEREMDEFLETNSGLQSRFPLKIDFPDYTTAELAQIARLMAESRGFKIDRDAGKALGERLEQARRRGGTLGGNARLARNILEEAVRRQSSRIAVTDDVSPEDMITLRTSDFEGGEGPDTGFDLEERLAGVVGLNEVKEFIRSLQAQVRIRNERRKLGLEIDRAQTLHMVFKGNPGTGKTMMARIVGDILNDIGVLDGKNFVETDRSGLVAGYVGQTALKTKETVKRALDGILFIDEAYSLAQDDGAGNDFGAEAIDTLVKEMDDKRDRLVVILAGYSEEMDGFLRTNPGLKSRFPTVIEFPDYTTDDLVLIASGMFASGGFKLADAAAAKMRAVLDNARTESHFGNGRYVRNLFEKAVRNQAMRLRRVSVYDRDTLQAIEESDIQDP